MILYLDTSSLLKVYLDELGSVLVERWLAGARRVAMSLVGYIEVRSGLARGRQAGRLNLSSYAEVLQAFEQQWSAITAVHLSEPLVRSAGALAERHLLRGFDAIHLASALLLQAETQELVTFSAWDDRLLAAAQSEGLAIAPKA